MAGRGRGDLEEPTIDLSIISALGLPFGAAMPTEYSRRPVALLGAATPELASVGVILGADGGAMGAQGCAFVR